MKRSKSSFYFVLAATLLVNIFCVLGSYFWSGLDFHLNGDAYLETPVLDAFEDPGVTARYCSIFSCRDVSGRITISSDIPEHTIGDFDVTYHLDLGRKSRDLVRTVSFVDRVAPVIALEGDTEMSIYVGEVYVEPGYTATDDYDGDLTASVEIGSNVDINNAGTYLVKYVAEDSSGNVALEERIVKVLERYSYAPNVPQTTAPVAMNTFDDFRDLILSRGYDMSFGFYRLDGTYSYLYRADTLYYGASLIKAIDGMYAYEMTSPTPYQKSLLSQAIAYSINSAHLEYVASVGFDNVHAYCANLGSKYCLNGSVLVDGVGWFSDTTVNDQILIWRHLYDLIQNPTYGGELSRYYINNSWSDMAFYGSPTHLHKNGILDVGYHMSAIFLADRPYVLIFMSNENYRPGRAAIFQELSSYVYDIQSRLP